MGRLLILLILTTIGSCGDNTPTNGIPRVADTIAAKTVKAGNENIDDRLKNHFDLYRIMPSIEINNTEGDQIEIQLANHKIRWLNTEDETKIKIDNDLFTLKGKVTLNIVHHGNDSVEFANNWDEIKLFNHNGREYIGIRMSFSPCTGLGCSVDYFLIYDVKTKTKNFFGTFRSNNELALYDFSNDARVDYVSKTFNGDAHGSTPIIFIYDLYSLDINGQFKELKNNMGLPYQIKHSTFPDETNKSDQLFERWITSVK
ncbi:MAG TPA: hypothetical protein VEA37_10140 [Flavobacterium sp.]|nr:hypothetical protein [Flavobacterium sp.]